jgi:hypothetical protein
VWSHLFERVVLVSEHDISLAILRLMELEKAVVDGACAAPLAACLAGLPELKGKKIVLPLCGRSYLRALNPESFRVLEPSQPLPEMPARGFAAKWSPAQSAELRVGSAECGDDATAFRVGGMRKS